MSELSFQRGKVPRNELTLPTLYFPVADQWIDALGEKAFTAWLKFYTWCDRSSENDSLQWQEALIPDSYEGVIKRLGCANGTFFNKILRPLWNYGLIDVVENTTAIQKESKKRKPMNIIVYTYPQNDINLAHQNLKKIRDYDKDYNSDARIFAKQKGKYKKTISNPSKIEGLDLDLQKMVDTTYRPSKYEGLDSSPVRPSKNRENNSFNLLDSVDSIDPIDSIDSPNTSEDNKQLDQLYKESLKKSLPNRTYKLLYSYSKDFDEMNNWKKIICIAKKNVEKETNVDLLWELYPEIDNELTDTVKTVIRFIKHDQSVRNNPDGYIYKAVYNNLSSLAGTLARQEAAATKEPNSWLDD